VEARATDDDATGTVYRLCPLCGCDNAAVAAHRYSNPPWTVKRCAGCGFVYIDRAPDYTALHADLAWERTSKIEERRRADSRSDLYKSASRGMRWLRRFLPRKRLPLLIAQHAAPGNVVDLGCGDGGQLHGLDDRFVPFGVEISAALAASADEDFARRGGRVVNAPSLDGLADFPENFFTAASLRSYLEHEMQPAPVLRALHRVLRPGGVVIVKVPNYGSLNRMVMGRKWCGFRYPDHLNYFTPATLRAMAEQCGYRASFGLMGRLPTSDNMHAVLTRI
jgi:SAM-dependent methyltransferase